MLPASAAFPEGEPRSAAMALGVRSRGNDPLGETVMLIGATRARARSRAADRRAAPAGAAAGRSGTTRCCRSWLPRSAASCPACTVVLDRLLDLLVISGLVGLVRARGGGAAGLWFAAHADPLIGTAIELLHDAPERAWTGWA